MLKTLISILSLACVATSCSSVRSTTSRPTAPATSNRAQNSSQNSVQFINNIAIKPDAHRDNTGSSVAIAGSNTGNAGYASGEIENYPALQFKYAILENATVEEMDNQKLLTFMEYWYGTPYHYGG